MTHLPALQIPLPDLSPFCQQWQITELAAFGYVLRDDFHDTSDIDRSVTFTPKNQWGLLTHAQMQ